MVADDDPGRAGVQAGQRVVAPQHPLDEHRQPGFAQLADRLEPGGGVLLLAGLQRGRELGPGRAVPGSEPRHVAGEHDPGRTRGRGPAREVQRAPAVLHDVGLEPPRSGRHLLEPPGRTGRQHEQAAGGRGAAGGGGLAVGVGQAVRGGGADQDGSGERRAEQGGGGGHTGHVAQHVGPQPDPPPGVLGLGQAHLLAGAPAVVAQDVVGQHVTGPLEVGSQQRVHALTLGGRP